MLCSRPPSRIFRLLAVAALACSAGLKTARAEDPPCPTTAAQPAANTKPGQPAIGKPSKPADLKNQPISIDCNDGAWTVGLSGDTQCKGGVVIRQGDREIRTEELQYDAETQRAKVMRGVEYTDPQIHVKGGDGSYSPTEGGQFNGAEFELRERSAHGAASAMSLSPEGKVDLKQVQFSTCPREDEAWQLRAGSITLDTREQVGTGRNARVDFKGVPILYLPWVSFPLGGERKSGFLFPSLGHSTRGGLQFALPWYWNIAPNMDFTFQPVEYTRRGADLAGEFRYLSERQRGKMEFDYLPNDQVAGDTRSRFKLEHLSNLPYGLRFSVDAQTVSDSQYFEDFAQGPEGTSVAFLDRIARLSYRDEHWLVAGEIQKFQTIDRELIPTDRPYARLPRLIANADFGWGPAEELRYGLESELVNFDRNIGVTGWRLDATPTVGLDVDGAGYFLRPSLAWRYTQYQLSHLDQQQATLAPLATNSPSRSLPIMSFDTGLFFEREAGSHGQRRVTLEPRLLYLKIPYRTQDSLPLFDTGLPDLNLVQLFRANRYVGADRVGDANQLSLGVTTRLLEAASGAQYLAATFGQIRYFGTPKVLLPDEEPRTDNSSDLVAQINLTAFKNWNADLGLQWNPESSHSERALINLQYRPGDEKVVNAGYRYQRDRLDQGELSAAWPVTRSWNAFGRYVHSFRDNTALERFAGFEYHSCCWRLRFLGRRFVSSRTGEQDTGFYLQLELTGLASVGSAADAFLTNAIRGYSRPDPTP